MNPSEIYIPTLLIQFDLPLRPHQIPHWRGAVAESAGWSNDLFHNHQGAEVSLEANLEMPHSDHLQVKERPQTTLKEKLYYRYPLIQYRSISGMAAIVGIGDDGTRTLRKWLFSQDGTIFMAGKKRDLMVSHMEEKKSKLKSLPKDIQQNYFIKKYLPLNGKNYQRWQEAKGMIPRIKLLQEALVGHILGFSESMDYRLPIRLEVEILEIRKSRIVKLHGIERAAFNLVFTANIDLPPGIALGKGVSHGYGVMQ